MKTMKAICSCQGYAEDKLVMGIRSNRFDFTDEWSGWTFFWFIVLLLVTSFSWVFIVLGWNGQFILDPPYFCQLCRERIHLEQYRFPVKDQTTKHPNQ